jgi:hypothetical protein
VDPYDDPKFRAWTKRVRTELIPMIEESDMTVSFCPVAESVDLKFAVELGLSIMLDKPIIVAVPPGVTVPERLVRVADEIVELTAMDAGTAQRINEAVDRVQRRTDDR